MFDPIDIGAGLTLNGMPAICPPVQLLYPGSRPGFKSVSAILLKDFKFEAPLLVVASHYRRHAYDQWSVDDVLRLAK